MDHSDVGLRAAIRALSDVVAPMVGAEHDQAREQLRLTIDYLRFLAERLDDLPQRHRFELTHHLEMAEAVRAGLADDADPALTRAIEVARAAQRDPAASASVVRRATAGVAGEVAQAVRAAGALPDAQRRALERTVLRFSTQRIAFERAWYLPLGLDPDPHEVQPLSTYLDPPA